MKSLSEKLLLSWALPVASVRQQPVYLPERSEVSHCSTSTRTFNCYKKLPEATILVQQADVTKEEEVQHVIKLTMEKYGRIDVLFKCRSYANGASY